jgi:general secretion pathway protein C
MHIALTYTLLVATGILRKDGEISRRWNHFAPMIVSTCLCAAIVTQVTTVMISLRQEPREAPLGMATRLRSLARTPGSDVSAIVQAHLFGVAEASDTPEVDAPATRQVLSLTATFAKPDPRSGLAIIGDGTQPSQLYRPGAAIAGGAVLEAVFFDRVILRHEGSLETLAMRSKITSNPGATEPKKDAPQYPSTPPPAASQPTQSAETSNTSVRMNNFVLMPVFGDRSAGARIGNLKVLPAFTRAGLKSGDIITAISGEPIHAVGKAATLLQAAAGGSLTVTIKRGTGSQDVQVESLD